MSDIEAFKDGRVYYLQSNKYIQKYELCPVQYGRGKVRYHIKLSQKLLDSVPSQATPIIEDLLISTLNSAGLKTTLPEELKRIRRKMLRRVRDVLTVPQSEFDQFLKNCDYDEDIKKQIQRARKHTVKKTIEVTQIVIETEAELAVKRIVKSIKRFTKEISGLQDKLTGLGGETPNMSALLKSIRLRHLLEEGTSIHEIVEMLLQKLEQDKE